MTSTIAPEQTDEELQRPSVVPLALAICAVYIASALWMPDAGFWIYDTAIKFIQLQAIVETGQFALDWSGRLLDPDLEFGPFMPGFYALRTGELHASYSPVFPMLSAPFYWGLGTRGLLVLPLLGAFSTFVAVCKLAALVSNEGTSAARVAMGSLLVVAFATPIWFYALTFWEHAPAAGFACWSVWACVKYQKAPNLRTAAYVGALAALPIYFRPENYLFALVVLAAAGWPARHRRVEFMMLGGACVIMLLPLWGFHFLTLGHPLGLHIQSQPWGEASFAAYLADRGVVAGRVLLNLHANLGWSMVAGAPFVVALIAGLRAPNSALRLGVPWAALAAIAAGCIVLFGQLQAPRPMNWLIAANGLFAASPLLILAMLNPSNFVRDPVRRARRTVLGIALGFAGLYAAFIPEVNSKGIHWGCRYLLCVYPLLAVLASSAAVEWWERFRPGRLAVTLVATLFCFTVGLQLYSLVMLHDRKSHVAELNRRVLESNAEIVITDLWFLPADLAWVFFEKPVFFGPHARRPELLRRMRAAGIERALFVDRILKQGSRREPDSLSDGWLQFAPVSIREKRLSKNSGAVENDAARATTSAQAQQLRDRPNTLRRLSSAQHEDVVVRVEGEE